MLSTVSVEAVYSATYVENYLDCVENFPDELQRLISRIRELDVSYLAMVKEVQDQKELYMLSDNPKKKARIFAKMQHALIQAQELGDEKMAIMQNIHDKIETKTRLLDQDYKNLDFGKEEPPEVEMKKEPQTPVPNNVSINNTSSNHTGEKPNKRVRRSRHETTYSILNESQTETPPVEHTLRSQVPAVGVTTGNTPVSTGAQKKTGAGTGKKKKRKSRQGANAQQNRKDDSPPPEEPAIDPDEPTYCLCDQISFGEMIMCDNDLCPIEWFHFSCVELSTKPKGKWFCPKCRGDRPNVMKPKAQFLKELEKYNKEKEEKT